MTIHMKRISMDRTSTVVSAAIGTLLLAGCTSGMQADALLPAEVTPEMFNDRAVIIGSMLTPDDRFDDEVVLWNLDTKEQLHIMDATYVPVSGSDRIELSVFALALQPGEYVYSNHHDDRHYAYGEARKIWKGSTTITKNALEAGDFVYVGRFVCRPKETGCEWFVLIEDAQDIPAIKALNPHLPWNQLEISAKRHPRAADSPVYKHPFD